MTEEKQGRSWKFLGLALLTVILILAMVVLWEFVDVLLLGLGLAYVIHPIAKFLNRGRTEKGLGYLIASATAVLLIAIPLFLAIYYGINFTMHWIIENLPSLHSGAFLVGLKKTFQNMGLGIVSDRIAAEVGKFIAGFSGTLSTSILKPTWLMEITVKIMMFFIVTFYFVYEGPELRRLIDKHVPSRVQFLRELIFMFDKICYNLFVSHFFTAVIITLLASVGVAIFIRPTLVVLLIITVLMFVTSFLPVIGPWLIYVPVAIWQLFLVPNGTTMGIAFLVYSIVILTLIPDFYLRPMLIRRGVDIHPLLLILGFFGGPMILGIRGLIIGPLVLGLAQAIVTLYIEKRHILKELVDHF